MNGSDFTEFGFGGGMGSLKGKAKVSGDLISLDGLTGYYSSG